MNPNSPSNNSQGSSPFQQPQQGYGQPIAQPTNPQMMGPAPQPNSMGPQTISSGPYQQTPYQQNPYTQPQSTNNKKLFMAIGIAVAVVAFVAIAWLVLANAFGPKAKTMAEFEQIMTGLGYEKSDYSWMTYSDSDGSFTTYTKGYDRAVAFYDANNRSAIKSLIKKEMDSGTEAEALFRNFDLSKDYNANGDCYDSNPTICYSMVQRDNTLLLVAIQADDKNTAKAEVDEVVKALNY